MKRIPTVWLACVLLALSAAGSVSAQVRIEGRVLDDVTEEALAGARVFLLNRYNRVIDYATTDEAGRFGFNQRNDGWFRVEASAVGYLRAASAGLWMARNREFVGLEMRLARTVVLLAPVEIVAMSEPTTSHMLEAVEHRRLRGFGIQITRQDIEERQPAYLTDILTELPGVYAQRRGSGASSRTISMGRALAAPGGGECPVQIFVDGMLATRNAPGGDVSVDELVSPQDVEAVEVFRGLGTVPPEFLNQYARCGVIAIWTRRSLEPLP